MIQAQKEGDGLNKGAAVEGVGRAGANAVPDGNRVTTTLSDVGISKKLSSRSQAIASIPEPDRPSQSKAGCVQAGTGAHLQQGEEGGGVSRCWPRTRKNIGSK